MFEQRPSSVRTCSFFLIVLSATTLLLPAGCADQNQAQPNDQRQHPADLMQPNVSKSNSTQIKHHDHHQAQPTNSSSLSVSHSTKGGRLASDHSGGTHAYSPAAINQRLRQGSKYNDSSPPQPIGNKSRASRPSNSSSPLGEPEEVIGSMRAQQQSDSMQTITIMSSPYSGANSSSEPKFKQTTGESNRGESALVDELSTLTAKNRAKMPPDANDLAPKPSKQSGLEMSGAHRVADSQMMALVSAEQHHQPQATGVKSSNGPHRAPVATSPQWQTVVSSHSANVSAPNGRVHSSLTQASVAGNAAAIGLHGRPAPLQQAKGPSSATRHMDFRPMQTSTSEDAPQQAEKPAGYSYATSSGSAYTHTSELSPSRREMLSTEQVSSLTAVGHGAGGTKLQRKNLQFEQHYEQRVPPPSGLAETRQQQFVGRASSLTEPQFEHARLAPVPQPHLSPTNSVRPQQQQLAPTGGSPCRPPAHWASGATVQQQLQLAQIESNDLVGAASLSSALEAIKFVKAGEGTRLRSQFIFKVLRADSLTDCELACARSSSLAGGNSQDACKSFNFRAYFAAENCELSRHELRNLRLDDATQFEQHTQFDFYALDPPLASNLPLAPLASSGNLQLLQQQLNPDLPECLDVSQSCSQDGMEFTLRTQEPFAGRIYTYGYYDSCFLRGDGSTSNRLRISRANGFPRCGTQQIGDLMTNLIVVQFSEHVQTTRDRKYNISCYFSGPGEAVVTSSYLDTKLDERSRPVQVEHLPPQNVITSNVQLRVLYRGQPTNAIAVGDLLTFRLENTNGLGGSGSRLGRTQAVGEHGARQQTEIFATNVIAKDPYSGRQVQLIDARGCPVDPVNVFPELQRTPDGALESEFYAFKIPDSSFLIFQATVRTCRAPCEPVICQTNADRTPPVLVQQPAASSLGTKSGSLGAYLMAPHQSSAPSWGRRRKRDATAANGNVGLHEPEHLAAESALGAHEEFADRPATELLVSGESVEHVIPVRLITRPDGQQSSARTKVINRPDMREAEEEVKEMFRVYMSRAELTSKLRREKELAGQRGSEPSALTGDSDPSSMGVAPNPSAPGSGPNGQQFASQVEPLGDSDQQVCMAPIGYYTMLFAIISLSLLISSVVIVLIYISRKAKFNIGGALADSMF